MMIPMMMNPMMMIPMMLIPMIPNSSSIHINTNHKRQNRFTQLMDRLPLGGKLVTPGAPQNQNQNQNQNTSPNQNQYQYQNQPSMSPSMSSLNPSISQLEVTSVGDNRRSNASFLSEELFLDMETGEEFHDPHR
ncbi:myb-like protein Z [Drosophila santomea]|uniref:myb-like protein Z n=1 Tax=Drosophila santomea TaxID=129105 RepID=UPI001CCDFD3C|nr:myb-like protein Z [Drosophila santomea]